MHVRMHMHMYNKYEACIACMWWYTVVSLHAYIPVIPPVVLGDGMSVLVVLVLVLVVLVGVVVKLVVL